MQIQTLYVIMNEKNQFFSSENNGVKWWATYFTEAQVYINKTLAERANKKIGGEIYKTVIRPEQVL